MFDDCGCTEAKFGNSVSHILLRKFIGITYSKISFFGGVDLFNQKFRFKPRSLKEINT
jgi:hypothetical protein